MWNARSTYADKKVTKNYSKQRLTLTNPQLISSHPKQNTMALALDKMAKNINSALQKVVNSNDRFSLSTSIKPNQKTLIFTISSLLSSFDRFFQSSQLELDMIIEIYRMIGYPQKISKTIFQPVGAPHTWSTCMQMMQWLAQLANFNFQIEMEREANQCNNDLNSLVLECLMNNDQSLIEKRLSSQCEQIKKAIQEEEYMIQSKKLALRNLQKSQKDIGLMQQQEKKLESILFRQKQEVIQIDQSNNEMNKKIMHLQNESQQTKKIKQMIEKNINSLEYEIKNQQLTVDEVQMIKLQIIELKDKIINTKRQHSKISDNINQAQNRIFEQYCNLDGYLDECRSSIKGLQKYLNKKGIEIDIPNQNKNNFLHSLKSKQKISQTQFEEYFHKETIQNIKREFQNIHTLLKVDINNIQIKCKTIFQQNNSIKNSLNHKNKIIDNLQSKLQRIITQNKHKKQQIIQTNQIIIKKIAEQKNYLINIEQHNHKLSLMKEQFNSSKKKLKDDLFAFQQFQSKQKDHIKKLYTQIQTLKSNVIKEVDKHREYFQSINQQLKNYKNISSIN